jgi:ribosomal-protein-alanine N-acetyltransferase
MQEALSAVIDYGFQQMHLNAIEAYTHPQNVKSIKLLEKNNFVWLKYLREDNSKNGKILDSIYILKNYY